MTIYFKAKEQHVSETERAGYFFDIEKKSHFLRLSEQLDKISFMSNYTQLWFMWVDAFLSWFMLTPAAVCLSVCLSMLFLFHAEGLTEHHIVHFHHLDLWRLNTSL